MADVVTIAGSPSIPSRSAVLLAHIRTLLTTLFFTYGSTRLLRLDRPLPGGF